MVPLCCVLYLQEEWSEEDWAHLEEAASCVQVVKVKVDMWESTGASRALAAGFSKNPLLTEVELGLVPEKLAESMRGTLCANTALTVKVSGSSVL